MAEADGPRQTPSFWSSGWAASAGLYILALVPRLNAIWRGFVTPDEPIWVFRAVRFLRALEARRWSDTFQIGHPGVLTMWMGALGIWWRRWRFSSDTAALLDWVDRVAWVTPDNSALFDRLVPFLPSARLAMAALTSLGVVGIYWLSRRLWDRRIALTGAALIALDPFIAGLSGLLHVDAPATTFMLLGLLAWLNALDRRICYPEERIVRAALFAFLSGFCAGLGMLSKSPAIWIAGAVGLCTLLYLALMLPLTWRKVGWTALLGVVWLAGTGAGLFTFPAMWTDPLGVIRATYGLADRHLDIAHRVSFFRGVSGGDPGPWFYPTVLLYRLTPISLAGLLFSTFPPFGRGRTPEAQRQCVLLASLWVFAVGLTMLITVGAKKFDRYLLPAFPAFDLVAAVGWLSGIRWLHALVTRQPESDRPKRPGGHKNARSRVETAQTAEIPSTARAGAAGGPVVAVSLGRDPSWAKALPRPAFLSVLVLLVILQGLMVLPGWPYYLAAYNPLMGGLGAALRTLPVGWGEGTEQMARRLSGHPGQVIATGSPVTLAPLVDDEVLVLDEASRWLADRILITTTDVQIYPERVAGFVSGSDLAETVRITGHGVLWLYDTDNRAEAEHLARYGAPGDLVLCDAPSPFARRASSESAVGPCQIIADVGEAEIAHLLNGWSAQHSRAWYLAYTSQGGVPVASPIVAAALRRQLETHAARLDHVDLGYVTATLYLLPNEPLFAGDEEAFDVARFGGQLAVTDGILL
ncbi:MAG: glycosyltransferase family 39 protein, partial [Anaerolineae bacterium]